MKSEYLDYLISKFELDKKLFTIQDIFESIESGPFHDVNTNDLREIETWFLNIKDIIFFKNEDVSERIINFSGGIFNKKLSRWNKVHYVISQKEVNFIRHFILALYSKNINYKNPFISFSADFDDVHYRFTLQIITKSPKRFKIFIRKFKRYTPKISSYGDLTIPAEKLLRSNILVSGATGSGKTTFLKSLLKEIPNNQHVVIIEDLKELGNINENTTHLCTSEFNQELDELLQNSLRMSPDVIGVGEIRSKEVKTFLLALNTGNVGTSSTIHANSAKDAIYRLAELLQTYSDFGKNQFPLLMKLISRSIKYVVHLDKREITEIIELKGSSEKGAPYFENLLPF